MSSLLGGFGVESILVRESRVNKGLEMWKNMVYEGD